MLLKRQRKNGGVEKNGSQEMGLKKMELKNDLKKEIIIRFHYESIEVKRHQKSCQNDSTKNGGLKETEFKKLEPEKNLTRKRSEKRE